jgi:hypothetical protein
MDDDERKRRDHNLRLWDRLFSTDPSQTKSFRRAGGFSGTAIKPYWSIMRATEEFGPVGLGWGWNELKNKIFMATNGQSVWFSKVEVWYILDGTTCRVGPQWGATELVSFRGESKTIFVDEEAAKKAITDGITKCLSYLGLAGDVHMGLFDDSKYVAERRIEERKEREAEAAAERKEKKAAIKKKPEEVPDNGDEEDPPISNNTVPSKPEPKVRSREDNGVIETAWLEGLRYKISNIDAMKDLLAYWETQKPMVEQIAAGKWADKARAAHQIAKDRMAKLKQGETL